MKRKTILIERIGAVKRVVQQIQTRPQTTTICPLCKKRFKKNDPTVLIDLVTRIPLTKERDKPEHSIRIQICEPCARPVIEHRQKVMDDLISMFAEWLVDDALKKAEQEQKRYLPESG